VFPGDVVFRHDADLPTGLRSRKKQQTRHAIEDAARELFAAQGYESTTVEQIAARADVSTTTFFRYFPSKRDTILTDQGERLPALVRAIVDRPLDEDDLTVLRHALQQEWVAAIDPERTARTAEAIVSSHVLLGIGYEIGRTWQCAISDALARRRGDDGADDHCWYAATVALAVFGRSVTTWRQGGCRGDLADVIDRGFTVVEAMLDR
jgi:AcrR family transcriptional regulator